MSWGTGISHKQSSGLNHVLSFCGPSAPKRHRVAVLYKRLAHKSLTAEDALPTTWAIFSIREDNRSSARTAYVSGRYIMDWKLTRLSA
jgi:hypothetical protein